MPQPISSSLMSRYVLNDEDSQCFHQPKMKKYQVEMTKNEAEVDGSGSRNFG